MKNVGIMLGLLLFTLHLHAAESANLSPNERLFPADGAVQVWVPGGEFVMGADDPESPDRPDERPPHKVTVSGFWMDKFEVTNEQYVAYFNKKLKDKPLKDRLLAGELPIMNWPQSGIAQDRKTGELNAIAGRVGWPVLVTWPVAQLYCEAVGKQLPTEAQWEFAARGTDGRKYPWGSNWDPKRANIATDKIAPVGSFHGDASPFGIFDMAGNVREFCWDKYDPTWYQKCPAKDPLNYQGTWEYCNRVMRGSGYSFTEWDARTTSRGLVVGYYNRMACAGFRCVAGGPPP